MTKYKLLIFIIPFLVISCNEGNKKLSSTDIFFRYLQQVHHISKENAADFYIIIPHIGCKGCMERVLPDLVKFIESYRNAENVVFIVANDRIATLSLLSDFNVLFDLEDKISKMAIKISGITIIKNDNEGINFFYIEDQFFNHNELNKFIEAD